MRGADLRYANLSNANLKYANLQGAELVGTNLSGVDLRSSKLQGVNFAYSNFFGANLREAKLQGSNFFRANFQGANLEYTNFQGANLLEVKLHGVKLKQTNFEGSYTSMSIYKIFECLNKEMNITKIDRSKLTEVDIEKILKKLDRKNYRFDFNETKTRLYNSINQDPLEYINSQYIYDGKLKLEDINDLNKSITYEKARKFLGFDN